MKTIEKKTWPEYFNKVLSGEKTSDLRLADWECNVGDILVLKEWDPNTQTYTGRELEKKVTYIMNTKDAGTFGISTDDIEKYGFMVLSLGPTEAEELQ